MTLGVLYRNKHKFQIIKYSQILPVIYNTCHKSTVDFDLNICFQKYNVEIHLKFEFNFFTSWYKPITEHFKPRKIKQFRSQMF